MYIVDCHNRIVDFNSYEWINTLNSSPMFSVDSSVNTILWGQIPFHSNIVGNLLLREEVFLWERLFMKHSYDFMEPVNCFNQNSLKDRTYSFVKRSQNEASTCSFINQVLRHKPNFLDFISLYHKMAKAEDIHYEMFQKSFFFEIFFHLLSKEALVCKPVFLAICRSYMGLDISESFLDGILSYYTRKYAYMIIPRRHGKTFMTGSAFVALLFTYMASGLRIGYYSHTKDLSQTVKNYVISKCNEWSTKLTQSRYDIMTPTDSILVKILNGQNTTVFTNANAKDDDFNCLAKFKSARNDNALRGDDLHLLIVDESFSINKNRFGTILAHGQKTDNKIIFLTSPVNHKVETMCEVTRGLSLRTDINFYHIYYFCNNASHLQYSSKYPACPRLIFYKPDHININETNRYLTNLLAQSSTSYDDELGIVSLAGTLNRFGTAKMCPFSERLLSYMKSNINTIDDSNCIENVFIYLDPNYCDSLQSGIGLLASGMTKEESPCILYLDHKFIQSEELGKVNEIMVKMLLRCIQHVSLVASKKRTFDGNRKITQRNIFVAVENNSQRNSVVIIYEKLKECLMNAESNVFLYYTPVEDRSTKRMIKRAGYSLINKLTIFSQTIVLLNEKLIWFSKLLHSHYLNEGEKNEIEYLRQNMVEFKFSPEEKKFSGKSHTTTDDLIVALVMSVYMAKVFTPSVELRNWLGLTCWTQISGRKLYL
uniref:Terminase n=1 Tax=Soft-shell clam herpesvirus 1 TaxID=1621983 RepID=A0A140ZYM8_9VIRU|nr:terminase [Soft-shell clam herpesvirus 1]